MSDQYSRYTPKKISEQRMKAQAGKNDGSDVFMDMPRWRGSTQSPPDRMLEIERQRVA